jgi:uncharacterized protein YjbJ (UPF0337 family)
MLNEHEIKGNIKQFRGKVKEKWGEMTDDEVDKLDGRKEQLVGIIQEKYGKERAAAEREVDEFFSSTSLSS